MGQEEELDTFIRDEEGCTRYCYGGHGQGQDEVLLGGTRAGGGTEYNCEGYHMRSRIRNRYSDQIDTARSNAIGETKRMCNSNVKVYDVEIHLKAIYNCFYTLLK